jgi:hypothetical protein
MNNFISGLILMLERPIRVGDVVHVEGTYGQWSGSERAARGSEPRQHPHDPAQQLPRARVVN